MSQREKAIELSDKALNNPELVQNMNEDVFFIFVISVAKYDSKRAIALEEIKPFTNSQNKILFWEAVGLLHQEEI